MCFFLFLCWFTLFVVLSLLRQTVFYVPLKGCVLFIVFIIHKCKKWIQLASCIIYSPVELWLWFPTLLRSRLFRVSACQLLLLELGRVHRGWAGQGFPQGRGGPRHHVGHWRLCLQRFRLSHGQSVSTLPCEQLCSDFRHLAADLIQKSCKTWVLLLLCDCRECAFETQCLCCKIFNIFNLHACLTEC